MTSHHDVSGQLADELAAHVHALRAVLPVDGLDAAIPDAADRVAAQILSGDDDLAAQTVIDVAAVLAWDVDDPHWWRTPLGQAVARSVGHPAAEVVTLSVAGAMLGISQQAASKLTAKGRLDRGPDGGVTSLSVRQLLRARHG